MNSTICLKKLVKQKNFSYMCIGPEKTEYHGIFKQKWSVFDKKFRKIKNLFMRNREIEIESMVGKSGKDMWLKLEGIGPKTKRKVIPEQVIINDIIKTDIDSVKEKWVFDFSALYDGVPDDDPNFDNRFFNEILANKHRQASSI